MDQYKYAQKALVALYGHKPASEFGPLGLKAVRQAMIEARQVRVRFEGERPDGSWLPADRVRPHPDKDDRGEASRGNSWFSVEILETRKALSRRVINQRIDHIRQMFKWLVSEGDAELSIRRRCEMLGLSRSSFYHEPAGVSADDLRLMGLIDRQYTARPSYGSRWMVAWLGQ